MNDSEYEYKLHTLYGQRMEQNSLMQLIIQRLPALV